MTELKTLKDIETYAFEGYFRDEECGEGVPLDKLRAEAIRWIKELQEYSYPNGWTIETPKNIKPFYQWKDEVPIIRHELLLWIQNFFNISEEELK